MKVTRTNITDSTLQGRYTTRQAAELLGVSNHQAAQLVRSGELTAQRTAGDAFLIYADSVTRYKLMRQGRGRPFSAAVAWGVLWLLSGLEVDWLTYQQRRRLLIKLQELTAEDLVWLVRRRAHTVSLRINQSFLSSAMQHLSLSGVSSQRMSDLGLTIEAQDTQSIEGYIAQEDLDAFLTRFHAVSAASDQRANTLLHVADTAPFVLNEWKNMPDAVLAVDLAASTGTRERQAGLDFLEELLDDWRT